MKCFLSDELINAVFSFHFIVYLCMWGAVRGVGRAGAFATYTNSMRTGGQAKSSALLGDNFIYRRSIKSVATFMFCLEFWSTHSHTHTGTLTHTYQNTLHSTKHIQMHIEKTKKQEMRSERRETLSMSEGHWNGMLSLCASVRYIELARSYRYKTHTHTLAHWDRYRYVLWVIHRCIDKPHGTDTRSWVDIETEYLYLQSSPCICICICIRICVSLS